MKKKNINIKIQKKWFLLAIFAFIFLFNASGLQAQLCKPVSFYNITSWIWSYAGPCTPSYCCLSYAIGVTYWEWPWTNTMPSNSQVDAYMEEKGYNTHRDGPAAIISYSPSTAPGIAHFAKIVGSNSVTAKWGEDNLIHHGNKNPYFHDSTYGAMKTTYYKTPEIVTISGPLQVNTQSTNTWRATFFDSTPAPPLFLLLGISGKCVPMALHGKR